MRDWPPIGDPELLQRLALDDGGFVEFLSAFAGALGPRELTPELYAHGLAYPWERPKSSYVLRDGNVTLLDDLAADERAAVVASFVADRHPIVGFGANAGPERLALKFAHFDDVDDRTALVMAGNLHGFDVGPVASVTGYGSMAATLFASPGTAVRAAVVWTTAAQAEQLTWSEISYRLGRLDSAHFVADGADADVDDLFAYISRLGSFCVDGKPVALAAVPAIGRTAVAMTQEELLGYVAPLLLGDDRATAHDLARAIFADMGAIGARCRELLWPVGLQLAPEHWTPFPG
jgi:hypothetical protein